MLVATILAAVPDDGTSAIPAALIAAAGIAGAAGLWVTRQPADPLARVLRRLRVDAVQDAPDALALALELRGLRPVHPWMVAAWLDGASVPEVPAAMAALHLGGRDGGRLLLRLSRGR